MAGYDQSAGEQKQLIGELEIEQEKILTERSACDTAIEKLRAQSAELGDAFNEVQAVSTRWVVMWRALSRLLNTPSSAPLNCTRIWSRPSATSLNLNSISTTISKSRGLAGRVR